MIWEIFSEKGFIRKTNEADNIKFMFLGCNTHTNLMLISQKHKHNYEKGQRQ